MKERQLWISCPRAWPASSHPAFPTSVTVDRHSPATKDTVLVLSKLINNRNRTTTAPQPHRTILKYFAILQNVAHSLKAGETPSISASHQASKYVQRS